LATIRRTAIKLVGQADSRLSAYAYSSIRQTEIAPPQTRNVKSPKISSDGEKSDQETIRGLTLVIGFGLLVESNPQYCPFLRKHLQSFITIAWAHGYLELCERSRKIQNIVDEMEMTEQSAA